ncbi:Spo0E family sporulation regulatory protein-aspartic acid phosphatase [Paenibacillus terreus]|uniref:Spo0E family sporulation regulatory protein-aspartic acid phosphatase n=1 Tax=Paenibacillus terreus TaxID=1387834 RepID=UPI0035CCE276
MISNSKVTLRVRIERERQRLHLLVEEYGELSHPRVVKQSIQLDELINQYNRMEKEKVKKPIA